MRVTMLLRRRGKRLLCLTLGCYAVFLLFTLTSRQQAEDDLVISLGPERRGGRAALSHHHHQDGEDGGDGGGGGDDAGEDHHEVLLPEALDRAIQQQPGAPAARKKLSRMEPRQVNVVVEEAAPDTFVKLRPGPDDHGRFKDLKFEDQAQKGHPIDRMKAQKQQEVREEEKGAGERGKKTMMVKAHPLDRLRAMRRGGRIVDMDVTVPLVSVVQDSDPDPDSGFRNVDPAAVEEEASEETGKAKGVWLAPDGAADDLKQVNTDSPLTLEQQPQSGPVGDDTQSLQTAATFNISVSNSTANFQELSDVTIYSAFYDDRLSAPLVRILAVGPSDKRLSAGSLWCVFAAEGSEPSQVLFRQTADCKRMKKYCFYMLHCQVPGEVQYRPLQSNNSLQLVVGRRENHALVHSGERLHLDVIVNPKRPSTASRGGWGHGAVVAVCVPPLYGKVSVLQLVEFVELNRLLGAVHFTFYTFRGSRELQQALALYQRAGLASVLPWNLPAPSHVWNRGQALALGDCLFRNMHLFPLLAFHDLDEVMVPRQASTWPGLLQTIHAQSEGLHTIAAAYQLLPVNFYAVGGNSKTAASVRHNDVQRLATLTHVLRGGVLSANLSKLMVRPERVLEVDVHSLVTPISELFVTYQVDPHAASLHHYGHQACSPETEAASSTVQNCEHLSEDRTVWRYKNVLVERTKDVLQRLYNSA